MRGEEREEGQLGVEEGRGKVVVERRGEGIRPVERRGEATATLIHFHCTIHRIT